MIIRPEHVKEITQCAVFACDYKSRYLSVAARVRAHWAHIAVIHRRESDPDRDGNPRFDTYLGNGQPLNRKTTIEPIGRGPFATFEDGAIDAWHVDALDSVSDWRLEKMLYYAEVINGGGYSRRGLPSPYLWSLTNIQKPGKYVADGKFKSHIWDKQPGCAPVLWMIAKVDKTVSYTRET
jgi:lysozyme family protein